MKIKKIISIAIFILFSNIVSAQLGVKFEKVDDPSTIQGLPEASEEQKAKCSDVTTSFRVRGFILPLSANKYEFEYNWNNNPIRFINAGGIIVDKHGELYSVDKEGNLILTQTNKFRGKEYTDDRYFDDDLIVYRWADLLLLRAEAYAALDKTPKAIIDLDEVRNRAGLQGYDGPTDKASVEKEICDERLRELFLEQKRWYDLVRFHFGGTINIYNEVPNLNGKENYPLYLPINYNDMVLNEHLVQTDGYDSSFKR
jgi:hypothetical protein